MRWDATTTKGKPPRFVPAPLTTAIGRGLRNRCPYCGVGCTLSLHVQENRIVKVTSPMESSVTSGHLCVKGRFGFEFVQVLPKGSPRE